MNDLYIDDANQVRRCIIDDEQYWSVRKDYVKIVVMPIQFNYHDIAAIKLKDGDKFQVEEWSKTDKYRFDNPKFIGDALSPDRVTMIPKVISGRVTLSKYTEPVETNEPPVLYTHDDMMRVFEAARLKRFGEYQYEDFDDYIKP
jgi:hypothetical protein